MNKKELYLFLLVSIALSTGCKKDSAEQNKSSLIPPSLSLQLKEERLVFNNEKSLQNVVDLMKAHDESILSIPDGFISLKNRIETAKNSRETNTVKTTETLDQEIDSIEEVVPDPILASILNKNAEMQVGGIIYKITDKGTFLVLNNDIKTLNQFIEGKEPYPIEKKVGERLFKITKNIFRYETFSEKTTETISLEIDNKDRRGPGNSSIEFLDDKFYNNLPTYSFHNGRNPKFNYFGSKHRVKLNFYNIDYLVVKTVGVNLKMQTKGWTGIWRKLSTEELRLGFDAIILESEIPLNIPQPFPSSPFDKLKLTFEKYKIISDDNLPGGIPTVSIFGNSITQQDLVAGLNDLINDQVKGKIEDLSKKFLKYAELQLNKEQVQWRDAKVAAFRIMVPAKKIALVAISHYEEIKNNDDQINKQFDFGVAEVGITINGGNATPTYKPYPIKHNIKKLSVYGIAKWNGQYKGLKIVK